jgi:hypothetical protein
LIETGKVTTLEEADSVEVLVDSGLLPLQTHIDVDYTIGSQSFKTLVKTGTTIGQFREAVSYSHKSKTIVGIASQDAAIDKDDAAEDWLQRTAGLPLQAMLAKTVQVVLDWRGTEVLFVIIETATEKEFKREARKRLSLAPKTKPDR